MRASGRLRVAFVARRFGARFGGAEAYGERIMRELAATHEVHVFCQEWDSELDLPHTVVARRAGLPRWLNLWDFNRRCARLTAGFDVVHSHENGWVGDIQVVHVMPVRYSRFHTGRSLGSRLGALASPRWLAYLAMEAARYRPRPGRVLVAASALISQQMAAAYRRLARCEVITPGVTLPAAPPDRAAARRELGLAEGRTYAVLVANDPMRKGLGAILGALPALPESLHLLVVGGENGMPERVRAAAESAGLSDRVHVWPGRRDVSVFYAAADLCVFPTLGDAFGMVPLEAMAHGLPVVLSGERYCGFARHVEPGRHALVLDDPRDAGAVAAAVRRVLEEPALAATLAAGGAALAATFDWAALADAFAQLYLESYRERHSAVALADEDADDTAIAG